LQRVPNAVDRQYFEFGAGWDLFQNIYLWCQGLNQQLLVDLNVHLRPENINAVIRNFRENPPVGATRIPQRELGRDFRADLKTFYGITYMAPADARHVPLPDGSVGLVSTTNTLEHIPFPDLKQILLEVRRLCSADALVSMHIDYSDHFSHADPTITAYNFLRFSEQDWSRFNSGQHYQNRRRHVEFGRLFVETGFRIEIDSPASPDGCLNALRTVPVHADFQNMTQDELTPTTGWFLLRPQ
jgi:hypothetical protein